MKQASTSVSCSSTVDSGATCGLSSVLAVPGSSSETVEVHVGEENDSVAPMEVDDNSTPFPVEEEQTCQPVDETPGPSKFLTSTPKTLARKCKKCPSKSKRIRKLKRINRRLDKHLQDFKAKYRQLKNEKVQLLIN